MFFDLEIIAEAKNVRQGDTIDDLCRCQPKNLFFENVFKALLVVREEVLDML